VLAATDVNEEVELARAHVWLRVGEAEVAALRRQPLDRVGETFAVSPLERADLDFAVI
jgi:hypothetical protein